MLLLCSRDLGQRGSLPGFISASQAPECSRTHLEGTQIQIPGPGTDFCTPKLLFLAFPT